MRADSETYRKVAKACSAYEPVNKESTTNSCCCDAKEISCTNCTHFDEEKYCVLDLYDKIVQNHHFE